ncbi:hypothetical protein [Paenarthrobacter sp. JL.01a]|uniref:hypothetical protein n=1 Tax=Paenarthrobacter sp. JL.01a TaxID=2979324 RepID=UPI0021C8AF41|nr:hypothetical protein [Paenarthrobacter sp. JL.01a]UXM92579.1 hypothetical protein N5P29_04415 [Paenarthrobacter sp. JL.01a]
MMGRMPILPPTSFHLDGVTYDFIQPDRIGPVEDVQSWGLGNQPKVQAQIPLKTGGTITVYAEATHWNRTQIHVRWHDDNKDSLTAWLLRDQVRPVTESEWDIDQYNRCPEWLRPAQWGKRLPGFLPE